MEIIKILTLMTLAICYSNDLWACALFYACNEDITQLFFVSSCESKHDKNIERNNKV